MTEMTADEVLTPAQAAEILGVSPRTLARYASINRVRVRVLPSGQRRYFRSEIERVASEAPA